MKIIILAFLVFLSQKSFSQQNTYTFNNRKFFNEIDIQKSFEAVKRSLGPTYSVTTVIYHKVVKHDTIVNYVSFQINKKSSEQETSDFKLVYKQDSTFLLLNKKLPNFKLKELSGREISLDQLLGKPTLINFWATYCGPCIAEMPQLSRLKEKYKDQMNFISITENNAVTDNLKDFLKDKDFNFVVLENAEAYRRELKIDAIPKNLFLDKNGVLKYIEGNYPLESGGTPINIDDEKNLFTKIIKELLEK
ncbi:TlpA disulfide reductase family protein [Pedobacter nutrimenti]|uniref:TlpA family protein disulfide reductase n=1 Tax=Pedobacter nutrimenti TaxID=1241337 RepID=UPI0029305257|nr:TlpA disulfide reductase family protein [Pedobacter nutrimenti]